MSRRLARITWKSIRHINAKEDHKYSKIVYQSLTAIFTGATHGIGLATLQAFLKYIPVPKAIIVGRSREKFALELENLQQVAPNATISFIEAELSLINEVNRVCHIIKERTPSHSVQLLCMSQGYAPIGPRRFNSEGLDEAMTLGVYGRVRLAERLTSQSVLTPNAKVISILGGGKEGHLFLDDMELKENYSISNLRGHFTSMKTLAFDRLSKYNPSMGFVHYYPGTVSTNMRSRIPEPGLLLWISMVVFTFLINFVAMSPEESGERVLSVCFGEQLEKGSYSVGFDGTLSSSEELREYRIDESVERGTWEHLEALWERAKATKLTE